MVQCHAIACLQVADLAGGEEWRLTRQESGWRRRRATIPLSIRSGEKNGSHPVVDPAREKKGGHRFGRRLGFPLWLLPRSTSARPHAPLP